MLPVIPELGLEEATIMEMIGRTVADGCEVWV
jgi:hypothetical protein